MQKCKFYRRPLRTVPLPRVELLEELVPDVEAERWLRVVLEVGLLVRAPRLPVGVEVRVFVWAG